MSEFPVAPEAPDVDALLARIAALRAAQPDRALALLREVDPARLASAAPGTPTAPVPATLEHYAGLLNEVLGETFELWAEALAGQRAVLDLAGPHATPTLLRQAAVAAQVVGDATRARGWIQALADAAPASLAAAKALVTLSVVALTVPGQDSETASRLALQALQPLAALQAQPGTALDTAFAAVTQRLATDLLDRPCAALDEPALRTALTLSVQHAERFWRRGGTWGDVVGAVYLRALAANALGEGALAAAQARIGLDLLSLHDPSPTDSPQHAFFQLELAQGLRLAGALGEQEARALAQAQAARFADAAARERFEQRVRRHAALRAHDSRG